MRTCISPGPGGGGSGTSRNASTSGPPNASQTIARIALLPHDRRARVGHRPSTVAIRLAAADTRHVAAEGAGGMKPIVAVIAPGMMGSGVGQRLARERRRCPHFARRAQRGDASERAKAAGMARGTMQQIAAADFILSIVPPGNALDLAERLAPALRDGGEEADLCRLQRGHPADRAAHRGDDRGDRCHLRRWRHHRRAAEAGLQGHQDLSLRPEARARRGAEEFGLEMRVQPGRSARPRR